MQISTQMKSGMENRQKKGMDKCELTVKREDKPQALRYFMDYIDLCFELKPQ